MSIIHRDFSVASLSEVIVNYHLEEKNSIKLQMEFNSSFNVKLSLNSSLYMERRVKKHYKKQVDFFVGSRPQQIPIVGLTGHFTLNIEEMKLPSLKRKNTFKHPFRCQTQLRDRNFRGVPQKTRTQVISFSKKFEESGTKEDSVKYFSGFAQKDPCTKGVTGFYNYCRLCRSKSNPITFPKEKVNNRC